MTSTECATDNQLTPQTPVLTVACKILRSPSHESVTSDLSLFTVSSVTSEGLGGGRRILSFKSDHRGHSPNPDNRVQSSRPADIPEILWFEEESEIIRNCAVLSSAVGLQKSFSTSDISQLSSPENVPSTTIVHAAVSELTLNSLQRSNFLLESSRLDHTSRSCSTWVAVGDIASTSQLPSPHGGHSATGTTQSANTPPPPTFTAADFIRSVNKKVRQHYIRRRLLTTYKAIERLSQSEFNLDRLEVSMSADKEVSRLTVPGTSPIPKQPCISTSKSEETKSTKQHTSNKNLPLTIHDVERDRGKPLSKYERNMMIFNWLHTLDDVAFAEGVK